MSKRVIVIGGGHNGLVSACYLAAAGLDVAVLERREIVGGAAVTEQFAPGFRNSTASYTVSLLAPQVISDLNLHQHGLRIIERPVNNFVPLPNGDSLLGVSEPAVFHEEIRRHSIKDVAAFERYANDLARITPLVRHLQQHAPPGRLNPQSLVELARTAAKLWRLTREDVHFLLTLFGHSAGELLDERFEGEPLKALLGFDSIVGNYASPYHPGTGYVLLHHVLGQVNGRDGVWGHAVGGMGAITTAMRLEAERLGVKIFTGVAVTGIETHNGRVSGVTLQDGHSRAATTIVANVHPKMVFHQLLPRADVPDDIHAHFERYKSVSATFRMNVALAELPRFTARTPTNALTGGIILAPDLKYMENAYTSARANGWSAEPVVEMLVPSTIDTTLAPPGQHVASLFCQHFDPRLGENWVQHRAAAADLIVSVVDRYAPNFSASILARQVYSPWCLEQEFGLVGGDIFHGRLGLDQLLFARPMPGMANYQTHLPNLYLCGSGTHPGGGVSGLPGKLAAERILSDLGRRGR